MKSIQISRGSKPRCSLLNLFECSSLCIWHISHGSLEDLKLHSVRKGISCHVTTGLLSQVPTCLPKYQGAFEQEKVSKSKQYQSSQCQRLYTQHNYSQSTSISLHRMEQWRRKTQTVSLESWRRMRSRALRVSRTISVLSPLSGHSLSESSRQRSNSEPARFEDTVR